jgi:hypothetical protein
MMWSSDAMIDKHCGRRRMAGTPPSVRFAEPHIAAGKKVAPIVQLGKVVHEVAVPVMKLRYGGPAATQESEVVSISRNPKAEGIDEVR